MFSLIKNSDSNKTIIGIQEAFISITPFIIVSSIITLIIQGIDLFIPISHSVIVTSASSSIHIFYPLILMISIAFHLARAYEIETHLTYLSSLLLYLTALSVFNRQDNIMSTSNIYLFNILSCIIPITTLAIIEKFKKKHKNTLLQENLYLDYFKQYIILFAKVYFTGYAIILLSNFIIYKYLFLSFSLLSNIMRELHPLHALQIRAFISQLLFYIGMHGINIFDAIFNTSYLSQEIYPSLSYKQYVDLIENNTSQIAIALCVFLEKRDKYTQQIVKLATPFLLFNIGEILLYRLPIVFNKFLFVPFIITPPLNLWIANILINFFNISFHKGELPWTTPMIINTFIKCNDSSIIHGVITQFIIIFINTLIFHPFVKRFLTTQSTTDQINLLTVKLNLDTNINYKEKITFHKDKTQTITSLKSIDKAVDFFSKNNFVINYEPKISNTNSFCTSFEAVVMLENDDENRIISQWHLKILTEAKLSPVIDIWASELVANDILQWKKVGFHPHISLGLHADTVEDKATLIKIVQNLEHLNVEFELCEQALLNKNVTYIREHGFRIVTKDFGAGMTSFVSLFEKNTDIIKISKNTFQNINATMNNNIYASTIAMCKDLGYIVIATEIRNEKEFKLSVDAGADLIQGLYVSEQLNFDQVIPYIVSINGSSTYF